MPGTVAEIERRHRSSTTRANAQPDARQDVLQSSLRDVYTTEAASFNRILTLLGDDGDVIVQDLFRRNHGFQVLLAFPSPVLYVHIERACKVLVLAFRNHAGNKRYFLHLDGWTALEIGIISLEDVTEIAPLLAELACEDNVVRNPQCLPILARLYSRVRSVLDVIARMIDEPCNRIAVRPTDTCLVLIDALLHSDGDPTELDNLCTRLLQGTSLDEARLLVGHESITATKLLLSSIAHDSASIRFREGHSALEVPCLPSPFPPIGGYTLTAWFRIHRYGPCHTTLFGAFDESQTCFVLLYLEKDSHQMILQTSINAKRPSVRFKKTFELDWYHVALVHQDNDDALLYINGQHVETKQTRYPLAAERIQCFFGTPRDLSAQSQSEWSLAGAHLYDRALSSEMIAVQCGLGRDYIGNFQDAVGQWLTYEASAHLNGITGTRLPETCHLINLSARSDISPITHLLSSEAAARMSGPNAVVVNASRPALNDSLLRSYGLAVLTGDVSIECPQSLSSACWRLGGFIAVQVHLLEAATSETLLLVLDALFLCLERDWRASEATEKENGYGIIALLLRRKLLEYRDLEGQVLQRILKFVGHNQCLLINPIAYRPFLLEWVWVSGLYHQQFVDFLSANIDFNTKRFVRMRIIKYMLEGLRGTVDDLESRLLSFEAVFLACATPRDHLELAALIVYTLEAKRPTLRARSMSQLTINTKTTTSEVGIRVLETYANILSKVDHARRFVRIVPVKWLLCLLEGDSRAIAAATRIIAVSLMVQDSDFKARFVADAGFAALRNTCDHKQPTVWLHCLDILFGIDPSDNGELKLPVLLTRYHGSIVHPEVFTSIIAMLGAAISAKHPYAIIVTDFLASLYAGHSSFREFANSPKYVEEVLSLLYPAIAGPRVRASTELAALSSKTARPLLATRSRSLTKTANFAPIMSPGVHSSMTLSEQGLALNNLIVMCLVDQVCLKQDFTGFGLFQRVPPGQWAQQSSFESFVLSQTMSQLWKSLENSEMLHAPRTLNNLARYCLLMAEAVFEGWFIDGAQPLVDFSGKLLDYLQQPQVAAIKDVRLCTRATTIIRAVFLRITLLRISELDDTERETDAAAFLEKLNYWQTILFAPDNQELPFLRLIFYLLYTKLLSSSAEVRSAAVTLFRMLLVHKPSEAAAIMTQGGADRHLSTGLLRLATHNDEDFLTWVGEHRAQLDKHFLQLAAFWEEFVDAETQKTDGTIKNRLVKRRERLKRWEMEETQDELVVQQLAATTRHWRSNICAQEKLKLQRTMQDQQESHAANSAAIVRLREILQQPCGLLSDSSPSKWQLSQTEGADRMRMRLSRDRRKHVEYRPKRNPSQKTKSAPIVDRTDGLESSLLEGDFEMVDDPQAAGGDKNRKVLRSLNRGDQIRHVCNVSHLVGLEACEGLLVIGRKSLYLIDGMFQRSDGEIVSLSQAPPEERDHYVQMISGREVQSRQTDATRSWSWAKVLSLSTRRFLFRDVAIEVFFLDGRSYLLILLNPVIRDKVFAELSDRAPHVGGPITSPLEAETWRLDSLRVPDEPQTLGSRFASVFNIPDTPSRKWARGELSNFHYLMLVNTMAGRTFNDLTQYPVFPWVLADYTSEELDLTNPSTFRHLSKPMGCQNPSRAAEFQARYQTFADMDGKPFHYGTHYSSAMIVTSYLIRLQPFVQSYLLLQGGAFDHADRLFSSIGNTWESASRQNMSDVRELIPEFFYLPEFLTNINGYDFGQTSGEIQVNDVQLPPWAKGDPHIFVAKHREALESPYVSQHLHQWIDLIFGCKQRDEGAREATNVFHPLSYHGAKDLDAIDDPVERMATIGIIHNFGQTPHQVFAKPHAAHESKQDRLDTLAHTLTKLPSPVMTVREKVSSLTFSPALDRLMPASPYRLHLPPNSRQYAQWLYADNSLRFFTESGRPLNIYEQFHIGPITNCVFADPRTLITGGADGTLGVWEVSSTAETVDVNQQTYLFGHRTSISIIAASRSFSVIVSASIDGQVITWDLNLFECIRILRPIGAAVTKCVKVNNATGHIMLCCGADVLLYSLNGHLLVKQRVCDTADESIESCAFYEGGSEWVEKLMLVTGHKRGIVKIWSLVTLADGAWHLQLLEHLDHEGPAITAILPCAKKVYTGDSAGRVVCCCA